MAEALRREETARGLTFDYCLIAAGSSLNRAPSEQRWEKGDVLSVNSGGNYQGYIGDLARMGVAGEPNSELVELLAEVESIQQAARQPIRAGVDGGEIYAAAEAVLHKSKLHNHIDFLAHGMGLVSHEAPRLTNAGPVPQQLRCEKAARCRHGDFGGNHAAASAPRLHQARGHGRRYGERL